VITGANSGVGYESAVALARKGAHVVMACRSMDKAERARQTLLARVSTASLDVMQLDLSDLQSVHAFVAAFQAKYARLDVLMNNAGIMAVPFAKTVDGFESQFGTNHLGHFALTGLLLPTLMATPASRAVTLSSSASFRGQLDFDNLQGEKRYTPWGAYSQSKLANIMFAQELERQLRAAKRHVKSIVVHPGYAATELQGKAAGSGGQFMARFVNRLAQTAEVGARAQLFAATAPEARGGEFYGPRWMMAGNVVRVEPNSRAKNLADAARLWQLSEQLTGVCYDLDMQNLPVPAQSTTLPPVLFSSPSGA
jgi:protochlorophyllide reductase